MAAEALLARGVSVDIYDAMPSFGRKFLMAGKSGLNISHAEDVDVFLSRYRGDAGLQDMVRAFGPAQVVTWMEALGIAGARVSGDDESIAAAARVAGAVAGSGRCVASEASLAGMECGWRAGV